MERKEKDGIRNNILRQHELFHVAFFYALMKTLKFGNFFFEKRDRLLYNRGETDYTYSDAVYQKRGIEMFCDYHVHSSYSDDSVYKMKDVVKDAILLDIDELCFTDHYDIGIEEEGYVKSESVRINLPKYFKEIEKLAKQYQGKIQIKKGMEFGVQYETIPEYLEIVHNYPMDFILLSVHQIDNMGYWNRQFQRGKSEREYYHAYYEALYKIVQNFHDYSVLAHMDLIRRYDNNDGYDVMNDKEMIETILKYIIADGKGLEINTSSVRYGIGDMTPAVSILKLYLELGGGIITIGSDSHKPIHLGAYVEEIKGQLKEIGFEEYCTFDAMQPVFHKL